MRRVGEHHGAEVARRRGGPDAPLVSLRHEVRQATGGVDVRVGEDHGSDTCPVKCNTDKKSDVRSVALELPPRGVEVHRVQIWANDKVPSVALLAVDWIHQVQSATQFRCNHTLPCGREGLAECRKA